MLMLSWNKGASPIGSDHSSPSGQMSTTSSLSPMRAQISESMQRPLARAPGGKPYRGPVPHNSEPVRKSRRLEGRPPTSSAGDVRARQPKRPSKYQDHRKPLSSPSINGVLPKIPLHKPVPPLNPSTPSRKRKRAQNDQVDSQYNQSSQGRKSQKKTHDTAEGSKVLKTSAPVDPIEFWIENRTWPARYSSPDFDMSKPLTKKRSFSSRASGDQGSNQETSNDVSREAKSRGYKDPECVDRLAAAGAVMGVLPPQKINRTCAELCAKLLDGQQAVPIDSLFRDDVFEMTCSMIQNENEARVIKDITWLIVASVENLAAFGATHLHILVEKVNSSWLKCIPLTAPDFQHGLALRRPQPDYSVGFRKSAFTQEQINKLRPFIGQSKDQSSVMARFDVYFPFLTCEVKCGTEALNIADRQNMHSASVSVKGIVELFGRVGMQQILHREILAFSISHDNRAVRIYGHYALINGKDSKYYRHEIHAFDITALDGRDKWTAYKFTRNVYDIFVPIHLKRLCDAINLLSEQYNFDVDASLSFPSQPERGDGEDESVLSSSQGTDSVAYTGLSSQTTAPIFRKPEGPRRG